MVALPCSPHVMLDDVEQTRPVVDNVLLTCMWLPKDGANWLPSCLQIDCADSPSAARAIRSFSEVTELHVTTSGTIAPVYLAMIARLPSLQRLVLQKCGLADEVVEAAADEEIIKVALVSPLTGVTHLELRNPLASAAAAEPAGSPVDAADLPV